MRLVNHHYNMKWVNVSFLVGALLLLGTWGWAVYDDYEKPYKEYQRQFYDVYAQQLKLEQSDLWTSDKQQQFQQKKQELRQLKQQLDARGGEVDQLKREIGRLETIRLSQVDRKVKAIGAEITPVEYRYQREKARAEENEDYDIPQQLERRYQALSRQYKEAQQQLARLQEKIENKKQQLQEKRNQINEIESDIQSLTQERQILEDSIQRVSDRPINQVLDAPILNFINPRVKIEQFQVSGMYQDYNFNLSPRRDYCMSCHMGIDKESFALNDQGDFENENTAQAFQSVFPNEQHREQMKRVFKAHPRLDLIGLNTSKFPFSKYGCSGCHLGDGRALEFGRAAHTPDNQEERERWKRLYDWKPREFWESPMLKSQYYEASLRQFYPRGEFVNIPDAPKLNEGRQVWRKYGCANCHLIEGMEDQRKIGFSLEHVAKKLDKDWVRRWVERPTDFDPMTKMPQVFHRSNLDSKEDRERSTVVIDAMTEYIFEQSRPLDLPPAPSVAGNIEQGKQLVEEVGCFGCHSMQREGYTANQSAPDLSSIGEKIDSRRWLYNWLKNPASIWDQTHMPSMKLTQEEANDITEYLLSLEKEGNWSPDQFPNELKKDRPLEDIVDQRLKDLTMAFLERTRGPAEAERLYESIRAGEGPVNAEATGNQAVKLYLGEQAVDFWGCSSCHMIPGHQGPNRIGPELTEESNKNLHKFGFNLVHIPHTRQDFIYQKLDQPGIYDRGMAKDYLEKLKMPRINLTDQEKTNLTAHIMSQKDGNLIDQSHMISTPPSQKFVAEGRKLVAEFNCQGCHTLDEESSIGEYLRKLYEKKQSEGEDLQLGGNEDPNIRSLVQAHVPPTLTNVGKRLTEQWMFKFLKNPVGPGGRDQIRTWQHLRMPNFQFTDDEASKIARGFVYEGWQGLPERISNESRTTTLEKRRVGQGIYQQVCANCHIAGGNQEWKAPQMTPNLNYISQKFHYEGFLDWIEHPTENYVPEGTDIYRHQGMIPFPDLPVNQNTVGFEPEGNYDTKEKKMEAVRDYLFYQQLNLSLNSSSKEE